MCICQLMMQLSLADLDLVAQINVMDGINHKSFILFGLR